MSYIDEICEMLGIEVDVPFKAMGNTEEWYRIRSDCHTEYNPEGDKKRWYPSWLILMQLIEGLMEVDWTPEVGEKYYYPTKSEIKTATWGDTEFDRKNKKMTGIYKIRRHYVLYWSNVY